MKFKSFYLLLVLGFTASACDEIAENDRYIEVEATKIERTVLLEDFTGQNCINCPAAHRTIEALEEQYGKHFIAVSIHAGHFGIAATNKRYTGLMQEEGQTYNDRYGIESYPQGVIDGKLPALNADQWATAVYDEVSVETPLSIDVMATFDPETKLIGTTCTLDSKTSLTGSLVVWVIESGIVARQEDINEGRITDYVHNNVFRACVNGIDGESVSLTTTDPTTKDYSIALKETETETWTPENLAIVAFVKTADGVVQAAKTNVTINQ